MLRQVHPYTSSTQLESIDNLDDMFKIMDAERTQIKRFMSENQENPTKWYPKFACLYICETMSFVSCLQVLKWYKPINKHI